MRTVAIVLAAGEGRRIGGPKALLPVGGETALAHLCRLFDRPGVTGVVAVLGARFDDVVAAAGLPRTVAVARNDRWPEGMLTSVWSGLEAARDLAAEAVLLHPVDNPLVGAGTVDAVVAALAGGARIAVPSHGGRRGHPAGFARDTWPALLSAPLDRGARAVLADHPSWVEHVPAGPDCLVDIDTPEDRGRHLG